MLWERLGETRVTQVCGVRAPREPLRAECLVGIRVLPFLAREGRHTCAGLSPAGGQVVVGRERFGSSPLLFSCFELKITLMAK